MRRFGTRRGQFAGSSGSGPNLLYLPAVGPYAGLGPVLISGLPSGGWDQSGFRFYSSQAAPVMNDTENIYDGGGSSPFGADLSSTSACFIWMNRFDGSLVTGQSILDASGQAPDASSGSTAAAGGNGGSGGGGGNAEDEDFPSALPGAPGGSGNNGTAGQVSGPASAGAGGLGWGLTYSSGYAFPNGGNSQDGAGIGGPGYGGGGASGAVLGTDGISQSSGAGGSGGGGITGVFNYLIGGGCFMTATGSTAGSGDGSTFLDGSSGGGGSIWLASRMYDGQLTPVVTGGPGAQSGSAVIYAILPNNTLVPKLFTDVWNYTT